MKIHFKGPIDNFKPSPWRIMFANDPEIPCGTNYVLLMAHSLWTSREKKTIIIDHIFWGGRKSCILYLSKNSVHEQWAMISALTPTVLQREQLSHRKIHHAVYQWTQNPQPPLTSELAASSGTVTVATLASWRRRGGEPWTGLMSLTSVSSAVKLSPTDRNTYRQAEKQKRALYVLKNNMSVCILFFKPYFLQRMHKGVHSYLGADGHSERTESLSLCKQQPSFSSSSQYLLDVHHFIYPSTDPVAHTHVAKQPREARHIHNQSSGDLRPWTHYHYGLLPRVQRIDTMGLVVGTHPKVEIDRYNSG